MAKRERECKRNNYKERERERWQREKESVREIITKRESDE